MTKQQEFRKQTEEAKFEAFSLMCKKVTDLEQDLEHKKIAIRSRKARIKELEAQVKYWKSEYDKLLNED